MVVPAAVEELDKADAALGHAAGEEAVTGKGAGFEDFGAVEFFVELLVFGREVGEFWHAGLHAEGHFLLGDGGVDFGVTNFGEVLFVEPGDEIEHLVACFARDAIGVGKEEDGVARGLEGDALVFGGEKARTPEAGVETLDILAVAGPEGGVQDDEVGEVFVDAAEAVGKPGSHGGFAGNFGAGAEEGFAGIVVDRGGGGGVDEGEFVSDGAEVGEDFGEPHAALAMLVEFEHGGCDEFFASFGHGGHALAVGDGVGEDFFEAFVELGLVVEEIELAGGSGHEEKDDAFGGSLGEKVAVDPLFTCGGRLGGEVTEDGGTEAHAGGVEELAAGLRIEHGSGEVGRNLESGHLDRIGLAWLRGKRAGCPRSLFFVFEGVLIEEGVDDHSPGEVFVFFLAEGGEAFFEEVQGGGGGELGGHGFVKAGEFFGFGSGFGEDEDGLVLGGLEILGLVHEEEGLERGVGALPAGNAGVA